LACQNLLIDGLLLDSRDCVSLILIMAHCFGGRGQFVVTGLINTKGLSHNWHCFKTVTCISVLGPLMLKIGVGTGFCGKCGSHLYATDPVKTLFMIRTGCLDQHHELIPAKHIFGKSAVEWVGEIADASWVAEGPASTAMTPFKQA